MLTKFQVHTKICSHPFWISKALCYFPLRLQIVKDLVDLRPRGNLSHIFESCVNGWFVNSSLTRQKSERARRISGEKERRRYVLGGIEYGSRLMDK